jgi:hypothetical protein
VGEDDARVQVNGVDVGRVPLELPFQYQEEAEVLERRISYFRSEPRTALLIGVLSLGITIPFHLQLGAASFCPSDG